MDCSLMYFMGTAFIKKKIIIIIIIIIKKILITFCQHLLHCSEIFTCHNLTAQYI